jgi:signal transduction histidine kinase
VATIQAGEISLQRKPEATIPLLREVLELHRALAAEATIELVSAAPASLPPIFADHDRILQIFSNLIGIALKVSPAGGVVTRHATPTDESVRFAVADTGPGIPKEDFHHLFDPFWQASKGARGGVGLGLPIAKGIVEAHGGKIWLESEVGRGTTIFFTIPTAIERPEPGS